MYNYLFTWIRSYHKYCIQKCHPFLTHSPLKVGLRIKYKLLVNEDHNEWVQFNEKEREFCSALLVEMWGRFCSGRVPYTDKQHRRGGGVVGASATPRFLTITLFRYQHAYQLRVALLG